MRHSRGRGRRGGRGNDKNSPKLPFKLRQELNADHAAPKRPKGSGSMFAVSRRKEERKNARHNGRGRGSATPGGRHSTDFKHFSSRPEEVVTHSWARLSPYVSVANHLYRPGARSCCTAALRMVVHCRIRGPNSEWEPSGLQSKEKNHLQAERRQSLGSCLAMQGHRSASSGTWSQPGMICTHPMCTHAACTCFLKNRAVNSSKCPAAMAFKSSAQLAVEQHEQVPLTCKCMLYAALTHRTHGPNGSTQQGVTCTACLRMLNRLSLCRPAARRPLRRRMRCSGSWPRSWASKARRERWRQ